MSVLEALAGFASHGHHSPAGEVRKFCITAWTVKMNLPPSHEVSLIRRAMPIDTAFEKPPKLHQQAVFWIGGRPR